MIRVAHLLPSLEIGGRERIVADLCRTADAHGVAPTIITYDRTPEGRATIAADDVPVIALDRRAPDFALSLHVALLAARIDVVHAQGHIPAALAAPGLGGVPMLATLHIALGSGWRWLMPIARGLRAAAALTAVSDDLAERFARVTRRPIETVATGVDLSAFTPAPIRQRAPLTVGIAARLHPVKRHGDAIAALRLLADRGRRCRLLIAGEGPCAAEIARAAAGLDVKMVGAVDDMPGFLAGLDAFLLPSDHEGTPAALLEAMATGLPCVATRVGGVPALAGGTALLVPRRRPEAIADAIARLIADAGLRARLGDAAAVRARGYSLDHSAARYAELYRAITDRRAVAA